MKEITFFKRSQGFGKKAEFVDAPIDPEFKKAYIELELYDSITVNVGSQFVTVQNTPAGINVNLRSFRLKRGKV